MLKKHKYLPRIDTTEICIRCFRRGTYKTRRKGVKGYRGYSGNTCLPCKISIRYGFKNCLEIIALQSFQNNKCLYCGLELPKEGTPVIEHDHRIIPYGTTDPRWKTLTAELKRSSIRGLVHSGCNTRAGHIDEYFNSESLQVAYQSVIANPPAQAYFQSLRVEQTP